MRGGVGAGVTAVVVDVGDVAGLPCVDFVALHWHARQRCPCAVQGRGKAACGVADGFVAAKRGVQGQEVEPLHRRCGGRWCRRWCGGVCGCSFAAVGVADGVPEYLQAAAYAEHAPALCGVGADGSIKPLGAQPVQVGNGGFAAWQNNPVLRLQVL